MRKVSFRVRNFDKEQFLTFNIDNEAELDEDLLDFLEDEEPKGIVPVIFEDDEEDFDTFSYNITEKIRLSELSNQEINAEMVLLVMRGIVIALTDMSEYRVPLSYLVLNRNYIYIDSDYKVEFICIPLEDMQEDVDINGFLRGFLANLRYDSTENSDYVAKLLTYINNPAIFNMHNLLTLVEDLMDENGVEVPEDNASDIYVDYQEVEEKAAVDLVDELDEGEEWTSDTTVLSGEEAAALEAEETETEESETQEDTVDEEEAPEEEEALEENVEEAEEEPAEDEPKTDEAAATEEEPGIEEAVVEDEPEDEEEPAEDELDELQEDVDSDNAKEAQQIVDKLKEKVMGGAKPSVEEPVDLGNAEEEGEKKKKSIFKTKEATVTGVVIPDELDEFLAEKEREEQEAARHEESSLKIKKNIKVSRASIVKNTQEELKAAEEESSEAADGLEDADEEEVVSNSILNQTIGATSVLKGNTVPKVNPYLVRVNTDERIMITKQSFKIGKASMGVDYTVKGNGAVSRIHAIITSKDGIYYVKDNKSTNHTYVNGKIIDDGENALLTHDSKIVLGDEEFIFKLR